MFENYNCNYCINFCLSKWNIVRDLRSFFVRFFLFFLGLLDYVIIFDGYLIFERYLVVNVIIIVGELNYKIIIKVEKGKKISFICFFRNYVCFSLV